MMNIDIFISYKRKSLPTANSFYYRLTTRGYSTFFDLEEMGMGNHNMESQELGIPILSFSQSWEFAPHNLGNYFIAILGILFFCLARCTEYSRIEEGATSLKKLVKDINVHQAPTFMMILTATGPAYRRQDGIYVVPLNCLRE